MAAIRGAMALSLLVAAGFAAPGCQLVTSPVPVASKTPAPKPTPAQRPAALKGSPDTARLRVQKVRNFLFREKGTGKFLDPRLAQTRKQEEVDLEPGDYDELVYDKGRLRYALYGREAEEQPYVVERELDKTQWQAIEDGLDADGFWGLARTNWDEKTRFPFYYVLYTQGDAGYEASFTPNLGRLKTAGALIEDYFAQMGGSEKGPTKLPAGVRQLAFSQQAANGVVQVSVAVVTPDKLGEPVEKPYNLRAVEVDTGKQKSEAILGPTENAFFYEWPQGGGRFMLVGVKLTAEDGKTYQTVLPIRSRK